MGWSNNPASGTVSQTVTGTVDDLQRAIAEFLAA